MGTTDQGPPPERDRWEGSSGPRRSLLGPGLTFLSGPSLIPACVFLPASRSLAFPSWLSAWLRKGALDRSAPQERSPTSSSTTTRSSIFPSWIPKPDFRWAYSLANKLHVRTREKFILDELLFEVGECLDPLLLEETERLLRAYRFIGDADVFADSPTRRNPARQRLHPGRMDHQGGPGLSGGRGSEDRRPRDHRGEFPWIGNPDERLLQEGQGDPRPRV